MKKKYLVTIAVFGAVILFFVYTSPLLFGQIKYECPDVVYEKIIVPIGEGNPRNSEGDIIELKNDKLLLVYSEFYDEGSGDFAPARIMSMVSTDGGRTWGEKTVLQENYAKINTMAPSFLRLKTGEILLFYSELNSYTDIKIYMRKSNDGAESWSDPLLVTTKEGYWIMNNDRGIELSNGRILVPVSFSLDSSISIKGEEDHPDRYYGIFTSTVYYSDDKGKNWKKSETEVGLPRRGAMEPDLIELKDGRVMMFMRTQLGKIYAAYSEDKGITWGNVKPLEELKSPEAPLSVKRIPYTNDLLMIWNNNFELNHWMYGIRSPLSIAMSQDEGETWNKLCDLEDNPEYEHSYSSVTSFNDSIILTYAEQDRRDPPGAWSLKAKIIKLKYSYCLFGKCFMFSKFFRSIPL